MKRIYKTYTLDQLYDMLERCNRELDRYDMMEYDALEGIAISTLIAERNELVKEIRFKEAKEGRFLI